MRILLMFLALCLSSVLLAQKAEQAIEKYSQQYPQEKVVLSLSKNDYLAGETIYFKAYVLTGYEPSAISTNLYTELYDKNKKVISQQILPLFKGSGEGSFRLPASLAEDVYYIRAYTRYMLNFDEAFQYMQPVNIYNTVSMYRLDKKPVQWTAAAFAEGGYLLNEVASVMAVRLTSPSGSLPQSWKGVLLEKDTKAAVTEVEVLNNEVGLVRFVPWADKEYVLSITDNRGTSQTIDIPKGRDSGASLQVTVRGDTLHYVIQTRNLASKAVGYKLVGTIQNTLVFSATIKKSSGSIKGVIALKDVPGGILQVTLFNEKEVPVSERLCFLHQGIQKLTPSLRMDTLSFAAKGLNLWQLTMDSTGWPNYAVQVSDAAYPVTNHFLSDLYLTSDLTMPLHNATWYLQDVNESKIAALDAVLMTEKWKRFNWNELLKGGWPKISYYPEQYLTYKGIVRKGKKPQPSRDVNLVLKGKDSSIQFVQVKTDTAGAFVLENAIFLDTMKVYYQANKRKFLENDVALDFTLVNRFVPFTKELPPAAFQLTTRKDTDSVPAHIKWTASQKTNELLWNEKVNVMKEVIVRTKARSATEELDEKLSSGMFSSGDATIFDFVNKEETSVYGYTNILEWLKGRVPSFTLMQQDGDLVPMIRGSVVQVFLDEIPVDPGTIATVNPNDIAMVKVYRGMFAGSSGGGGAIAVYTLRGGMTARTSAPSMPNNTLVGYHQQPVLFSPDYSQKGFKSITDQREILFRKTVLYPSEKTFTAPIRFYNNDGAKRYRVTITGFTGDGQLVYLDKIIE
jgi:hypothetical protein